MRLSFGVSVFLLTMSAVFAQDRPYTFTKVIESGDTALSLPALTDRGAVVFTSTKLAIDFTAVASVAVVSSEVLRFENGSVKRVALDPGMALTDVSPNGSLLLIQKVQGEPFRLFLDQDGTRNQILETGDSQFSSFACAALNNNGDVVFAAIRDSGIGGYFLRSSDGTITTLAEEVDLPDLSSFICNQFSKLRINNERTVLTETGVGKWAFRISKDEKLTVVPYADQKYTETYYLVTEAALNAGDEMVFGGQISNGGALFRSLRGGPAEVLLTVANRALPSPRIVAINDPGDVAYIDSGLNLTPGAPFVFVDALRVLKKGASSPVTVVQSGDSLFGSTVTSVGIQNFVPTPRYMNNSGQIGFTYTLADRTSGIALANPK